jgi:hypothetical protein
MATKLSVLQKRAANEADPLTSKYDPLRQHLVQMGRAPTQMSFSDIERIIGLPLPTSARTNDSWWLDKAPNKHRAHAKAWLDANLQIGSVDRVGEIVIFTPIKEHKEAVLLEAVVFPIDKSALLERARQADVPVTVREALERLRDGTYYSRSDFVLAVEAMVSA